MRKMIDSFRWAWRRRHAARRVALQQRILQQQSMIGLDAGAAEGLQPHWWAYEGAVQMYCFEPHPQSADRLRRLYDRSPFRRMFHVLPVALAGQTGERTLYMLNAPTGSSLYPLDPKSEFVGERNAYVYPIRELPVAVRKLSEVLDEQRIQRVDIAKLDVQGAELEILRGLDPQRAANLTLVEVEVNIVGGINRSLSPYIGAPSWSELDQFLTAHGLRLLDVSVARSHRGRSGDSDWYQREVFRVYDNSPGVSAAAWEVDAVYVRDYRALIAAADQAALRRLIVALGGYRFFSEAYFIVEESAAAGVFTAAAASELQRDILSWHRLVARRAWHGRSRLWGLWRNLLTRLGVSQLRRWKQYMWFQYPNG
jgi:FkbM family methyltransferase